MNRPVPPGATDLSQSFCIVLICLVDLHLEGGACVPRVETNDFQPEIAEFMHKPRCHRSGFDAYASVISRMAADKNPDLFWNCGALTPPKSPASIVNDAEHRHLLRNVQPDKASHHEPPNVRITGQSFPDRGTIGRSSADRDYRMSTYGLPRQRERHCRSCREKAVGLIRDPARWRCCHCGASVVTALCAVATEKDLKHAARQNPHKDQNCA